MAKQKYKLQCVPMMERTGDQKSDVYVLDGSCRVLIGNDQVKAGESLIDVLGISQTEAKAFSLHLAGYGKESVLLCTGKRPLLIACELYARTGLLVALVTSVDANDVILYTTDDLRLLPGMKLPPSKHVPNIRYREEYNALLLATGRKEGSARERVEALAMLTSAHLFRDDRELDTLNEQETIALLGILFLAAMHATRAGDGVVSFAIDRKMGYAHVLLALRDDGVAPLDFFDEMQRSAVLRGMPFHLLRDETDASRVSLLASLTIAELAVQGVKQPDGSTPWGVPEPQPLPIVLDEAEFLF